MSEVKAKQNGISKWQKTSGLSLPIYIYNQIKIGLQLVRWLWLVAGNRYLQHDVVIREAGELDEDDLLTVRVECEKLYKTFLKGKEWKKRWGNKHFKKGTC